MFLAAIHKLHVPSITCSLTGNCTASCRDPDTMLRECKEALPPDLIAQLKRFLHHHNPNKFAGYITAEQCRQYRSYGNHDSVASNILKVESTINKEERNKHVALFPFWIEKFFPDLCIAPQGLFCKEDKSDRLVFDGYFLKTPFSTFINQFASTSDEIELQHGMSMARRLVQICNLRLSHATKEILLFDDDASGVFRHVKLHPQVALDHMHSVGQTLCKPIVSVFGANVSLHNWEAFTQSLYKKSEYLKYSPDLPTIVDNHRAIIDLIKLPKDTEK